MMNTLWISFYLISTSVSPQINKTEYLANVHNKPKESVYKMLVAKPKNASMYSCLKTPKQDYSKYRILNITPAKNKE
ncbi:hypothetical protein CHRYSEOSP005_26580 [Chryseobacterium sp. Alg-005]|uniref:hypothetical protein n=1 Tax=Chryseobacterium sp. Alg-005 TaxID=3159516 RepID=UPI003555BB3C